MSSTVGIQLASCTVSNWKMSLVGYAITITLWWYYKSMLTTQLNTVGLMILTRIPKLQCELSHQLIMVDQ